MYRITAILNTYSYLIKPVCNKSPISATIASLSGECISLPRLPYLILVRRIRRMPYSACTLAPMLVHSTVNMPTSSFSDSICLHQFNSLYKFIYLTQSLTFYFWLPSLKMLAYPDLVLKPHSVQLRPFPL